MTFKILIMICDRVKLVNAYKLNSLNHVENICFSSFTQLTYYLLEGRDFDKNPLHGSEVPVFSIQPNGPLTKDTI